MLIDVHAHFYSDRAPRADWEAMNASRLQAGRRIGITAHVASILGSWGARSPTYFPSPEDVSQANEQMLGFVREHPGLVHGYCVVNPNYTEHATAEIDRRVGEGMIGVKLAASRRADDPLLDPVAERAGALGVPILQHVWQHRRREWPGQEASDAREVSRLAQRHPDTWFILAHLGGGGDWLHTLRVVRTTPNIFVDISGSGTDAGMLEQAVDAVGAGRLLWGCDVTMDTGWAKLRYLEALRLTAAELDRIRHANATDIFPDGAFT